MLALVVEFRIRNGHVDAFERAILENARVSRQTEPGCRQFDVCRSPADPALFFLYELYAEEAAVAAHLQSAHFRKLDETTASWVERKTVLSYRRQAP